MAEAALKLAEPEGFVDEEREDVTQDWKPNGFDDADWALKRLGELFEEVQQNEAIAAKRIEEIHAKTVRLNARAKKGIEFFQMRLVEYALGNRDAIVHGKRKSRALVHGSVGFRTKPGALKVVDPAALLKWAQSRPIEEGVVRMKEEPAIREIQAVAEAGQLVPPGMQWEPEVETVVIKTEEKS